MTAARQGDCDMLRLLIHHGADLHVTDAGGELIQYATGCTAVMCNPSGRSLTVVCMLWQSAALCDDIQGKQPGRRRCMMAVQ